MLEIEVDETRLSDAVKFGKFIIGSDDRERLGSIVKATDRNGKEIARGTIIGESTRGHFIAFMVAQGLESELVDLPANGYFYEIVFD